MRQQIKLVPLAASIALAAACQAPALNLPSQVGSVTTTSTVLNRELLAAKPHPNLAPDPSGPGVEDDTIGNKVTIHGPKRKRGEAPTPGDTQAGTNISPIQQASGVGDKLGVYAGQEARTDLTLPSTSYNGDSQHIAGIWAYTPTLYSPGSGNGVNSNGSPLESVTVYHRYSTQDPDASKRDLMERFVGVWDHSNGIKAFKYKIPIDSSFMSRYTRYYTDYEGDGHAQGNLYFTKVIRDSGIWRFYIYDFNYYGLNNGAWVNPYSQWDGNAWANTVGWNQFEQYNFSRASNTCPSLGSVHATRTQIWNGSTWTNAVAGNSNDMGGALPCTGFHLSWFHQYWEWVVTTP